MRHRGRDRCRAAVDADADQPAIREAPGRGGHAVCEQRVVVAVFAPMLEPRATIARRCAGVAVARAHLRQAQSQLPTHEPRLIRHHALRVGGVRVNARFFGDDVSTFRECRRHDVRLALVVVPHVEVHVDAVVLESLGHIFQGLQLRQVRMPVHRVAGALRWHHAAHVIDLYVQILTGGGSVRQIHPGAVACIKVAVRGLPAGEQPIGTGVDRRAEDHHGPGRDVPARQRDVVAA